MVKILKKVKEHKEVLSSKKISKEEALAIFHKSLIKYKKVYEDLAK